MAGGRRGFAGGIGLRHFSQAFNPLGSISAVLVGSRFIFSGVDLRPAQVAAMRAQHSYHAYLRSETLRVVDPYLILGALCCYGLCLLRSRRFLMQACIFRVRAERTTHPAALEGKHFAFAVAAQFLYVGARWVRGASSSPTP